MSSRTEENYIKTLFNLANENGEINISELSKALEISIPTANSMIKKLHTKGMVNYEKYKPVTITDKGKLQAGLIIRKHRLTEMFLVEKMGFGWEVVHDIAEQMEHIKSSIFFERIDELLGYPKIDPHGSPIPDKQGRMDSLSYQKLSDCQQGYSVRLAALAHSSSDFLNYLNTRNIKLGIDLHILAIEPFDRSMTISYQDHPSEMFSQTICEKLLVERI